MREHFEDERGGRRNDEAARGIGEPSFPQAPEAESPLAAQPLRSGLAASGAARPKAGARVSAWWLVQTPNLQGTIFTISAFFFFTAMVTLVKLLGTQLPLAQILIVRQTIVFVLLLAIFRGATGPALRTSRLGLQVLRSVLMLGAMFFGFTAVVHMPVAEASALSFSQVIWVTLAAIVLLGEKVDLRRWIAVGIGLAGILIMLRPGGGTFNPYALYSIVGAMMGAGITISVRKLGETEKTETILFWQCFLLIGALAPFAFLQWVPPTPHEWLLLGILGLVGVAGQWLITRGHQLGEASAMAPLDFIRLIFATIAGYVIFLEVPDLVTILGATLVIAGTIFTVRTNARRPAAPAEPLP